MSQSAIKRNMILTNADDRRPALLPQHANPSRQCHNRRGDASRPAIARPCNPYPPATEKSCTARPEIAYDDMRHSIRPHGHWHTTLNAWHCMQNSRHPALAHAAPEDATKTMRAHGHHPVSPHRLYYAFHIRSANRCAAAAVHGSRRNCREWRYHHQSRSSHYRFQPYKSHACCSLNHSQGQAQSPYTDPCTDRHRHQSRH